MKIIYEDDNLLVADKPAGIDVVSLGEELSEKYPELKSLERNGVIHRLDKDTSGVILIARNQETLIFFQKQFKNRKVEKKYTALVIGQVKQEKDRIETLIGRSPQDRKKQKAYLFNEPGSLKGRREAVTEYQVIETFDQYTLLEVFPKTGRKHQIRCHLAYTKHPIAGDRVYGFKNQPCPKGLNRHFLHAGYIKVKMSKGGFKEFKSDLPQELKRIYDDQKRNI